MKYFCIKSILRMRNNKKVFNNKVWLLLFVAAFFSCHEKRQDLIVYKKPVDKKRDAVTEWLKKSDHFYKNNYMPVFYLYYKSKIDRKNYEAAAEALEIVRNLSITKVNTVRRHPIKSGTMIPPSYILANTVGLGPS